MSALDPNSLIGSIAGNVIATLVAAALIAGIAWFGGPLRWFFQNRRLRELLHKDRHFVFVFNPTTKAAKIITFLPNGEIGEGRNENEHTWRIGKGKLEIFASDGDIYSRFAQDKASGHLKHTNDTDTGSIHGQYLQPDYVFRPNPNAIQPGAAADGPEKRGPAAKR
jgi:hypothetical protein